MAEGKAGAETFVKEVVWREFAYHLSYHTPRLLTGNWKPDWDAFPWKTDETLPEVTAWKQGRTGIEFVDAAMREMYVTGRMHNRGRMIRRELPDQASGLSLEDRPEVTGTRVAMRWAGSGQQGPGPMRRRISVYSIRSRSWINLTRTATMPADGSPKGTINRTADALSYYDAIPKRWGLSPDDSYPDPIVAADVGRKQALAAYEARGF
ncbi:Deoxyribodipyrimidine photo-lyase [Nymphon striatum]|nr:Deoxyribodipyrimidine photo-lyase [Nymphon striatum]